MPKEEWGVKRICPSCAVRFYDLQRDPMTCPSCDAEFSLESLTAPKGRAARAEKAKSPVAEPAAPVVDDAEEVVLDDDDTDAVPAAGDDLLDDDEDDDTANLEEIADVPADDD